MRAGAAAIPHAPPGGSAGAPKRAKGTTARPDGGTGASLLRLSCSRRRWTPPRSRPIRKRPRPALKWPVSQRELLVAQANARLEAAQACRPVGARLKSPQDRLDAHRTQARGDRLSAAGRVRHWQMPRAWHRECQAELERLHQEVFAAGPPSVNALVRMILALEASDAMASVDTALWAQMQPQRPGAPSGRDEAAAARPAAARAAGAPEDVWEARSRLATTEASWPGRTAPSTSRRRCWRSAWLELRAPQTRGPAGRSGEREVLRHVGRCSGGDGVGSRLADRGRGGHAAPPHRRCGRGPRGRGLGARAGCGGGRGA